MEGTVQVEAVLAGNFPEDMEGKDAMPAVAAVGSPAALVLGFLAPPLSLLRHDVACLCAGYLGLDLDGGIKPSAPPGTSSPSSSSSSAEDDEDCTEEELVVELRSRGTKPPNKPFSTPRESRVGAGGGKHQ